MWFALCQVYSKEWHEIYYVLLQFWKLLTELTPLPNFKFLTTLPLPFCLSKPIIKDHNFLKIFRISAEINDQKQASVISSAIITIRYKTQKIDGINTTRNKLVRKPKIPRKNITAYINKIWLHLFSIERQRGKKLSQKSFFIFHFWFYLSFPSLVSWIIFRQIS